ncbi:hypothetical protein KKC44_00390 [Patescibacteria group bacterium]|nr:hypothetical protein [Patescibacteria group bacterium]MBU2259044.1 hypothetical protein [Patescibacteria group bacterium]
MLPDFISITNLQRQLKDVFASKQPMRVVLSNNTVAGIVFSKDSAEALLKSGLLDQLREELWELNDRDTVRAVSGSRKGKGKHSVSFDTWAGNQ